MNTLALIKSIADRKQVIKSLAKRRRISLGDAAKISSIGTPVNLHDDFPEVLNSVYESSRELASRLTETKNCSLTIDHSLVVDGMELGVVVLMDSYEVNELRRNYIQELKLQEARKWLQEQPEDVKRYVGILARLSYAAVAAL